MGKRVNSNIWLTASLLPQHHIHFASSVAPSGLCSGDTLLTSADGVHTPPDLRCWLDGQGRDKLIVTPLKHLSSLSEMDDDLMASFWKVPATFWFVLRCLMHLLHMPLQQFLLWHINYAGCGW